MRWHRLQLEECAVASLAAGWSRMNSDNRNKKKKKWWADGGSGCGGRAGLLHEGLGEVMLVDGASLGLRV